MRKLRGVMGIAAVLLVLGAVFGAGAGAAVDSITIPETPVVPDVEPLKLDIGTVVEAWYQLTGINTCGTPAGCLPAKVTDAVKLPAGVKIPSVSAFPADTLHAGFIGVVETARTYIKLDLSSLPQGAQVSEGELTLPIDNRPIAGTLKPEDAQLKACIATSGFDSKALGAIGAPPTMDCGVSSPLRFSGGKFVVDLAPFLDAWANGQDNFGLAITPFKVPELGKPFLVAFPSSRATKLPHIGGSLSYQLESAVAGDVIDDVGAATDAPFDFVGTVTHRVITKRKVAAPPAADLATRTVSTPVAPPSDWTVPIVGMLVVLAAIGGAYEVLRKRLTARAF